ncbi:MAG TPA: hypothetical protein VGK32_16360 [Vicinamibacterales bacterium]
MNRLWLAGSVVGIAVVFAACGGEGTAPANKPPSASAGAADKTLETRWLRGLWANDIRAALATVGMNCQGPATENRASVWTCDSGTPLVSYKVRFYGSTPGKIEYINAVVTQSGPPKDNLPLRLFGAIAGLHFDGADPPKAREWVQSSIAAGGTTTLGPAKYKLAGDATRRILDVKASGSEW